MKTTRVVCGFSLIEALLVFAIVAILSLFLFPLGRSLRGKMDQSKCLANLKRVGVAVHLYAQDHNGRLPGPAPGLITARFGAANFSDPRAVSHFLLTYLGYEKPATGASSQMMAEFICPAAEKVAIGDDAALGRHYGQFPSKYLGKPTIPDPVNEDVALYPFGYKAGTAEASQLPLRLNQLTLPSRTVAFSDRWSLNAVNGGPLAHEDRRNFLFFDGHVRSVPKGEMVSNTEIHSW